MHPSTKKYEFNLYNTFVVECEHALPEICSFKIDCMKSIKSIRFGLGLKSRSGSIFTELMNKCGCANKVASRYCCAKFAMISHSDVHVMQVPSIPLLLTTA